MPDGYVTRQLWAGQMARTHRQTRCGGCGRYAVWVPRPDAPDLPPVGYRLDHAGCGCCDGDDRACGCLYHAGAVREAARRRWAARKAAKAAREGAAR
jgi:hypothetical protein